MKIQTNLKEVPVGKTFEVWGKKFTVLKQEQDKTFVLAAEITVAEPFRDGETKYAVAYNDFRDSSVKEYLNGKYIDELVKAGADKDRDILPLEIDLKCTRGQHEFGTDVVKAGLLTLEQYGEYYDIIPKINNSWWLATPYKTPSYSNNDNTYTVWHVYLDTEFAYSNYYNAYGIRPTLNLNPSLLVDLEDGSSEDGTQDPNLSAFTLDELLGEIKKRYEEGVSN